MFQKKLLRKNSQIGCQLLSLPGEIQLSVINSGVLSVFDKACLMLTCKSFAMLVCNPAKGLVNDQEIKSGEEEYELEYLEDIGMDGGYESEEQFEAHYLVLSTKFKARVDRETVADFYRRLDLGWNQSSMRFCFGCGSFKSTEQKHWDQKTKRWLHNGYGTLSVRYQRGSDCHCGCRPDEYITAWTQYGKDKKKGVTMGTAGTTYIGVGYWQLNCPECRLAKTCDGCDCCDGLTGCGCGSCHQW